MSSHKRHRNGGAPDEATQESAEGASGATEAEDAGVAAEDEQQAQPDVPIDEKALGDDAAPQGAGVPIPAGEAVEQVQPVEERAASASRAKERRPDDSDATRERGTDTTPRVRANPIPALLVGLGATWFLMSLRRSRTSRQAASEARKRIGDITENVGEKVKEVATDAEERGAAIVRRARRKVLAAERRAQKLLGGTPLVAAAGAFSLGVGLGFLLPRTNYEDRWMGRTRDQMFVGAGQAARGAVGEMKERAEGAIQAVAPRANRENT